MECHVHVIISESLSQVSKLGSFDLDPPPWSDLDRSTVLEDH